MAPVPSPAKLSSLSTSLLSSLVELSRLQSLSLSPPPSSRQSVIKNLTALRKGVLALQNDQESGGNTTNEEVVEGLRSQYARLLGLVRGLGDMEHQVESMDLPPLMNENESGPRTGNLIGSSDDDAVARTRGSDQVHVEIPTYITSLDQVRRKSIERSKQNYEEDEEELRQQNEDVQLMQQTLLADQDRSLDALSLAISRQRDLSLHISSELETQEAILEELDESVDRTTSRLGRADNRLGVYAKKARENGAMCTIVGLIVILLVEFLLLYLLVPWSLTTF